MVNVGKLLVSLDEEDETNVRGNYFRVYFSRVLFDFRGEDWSFKRGCLGVTSLLVVKFENCQTESNWSTFHRNFNIILFKDKETLMWRNIRTNPSKIYPKNFKFPPFNPSIRKCIKVLSSLNLSGSLSRFSSVRSGRNNYTSLCFLPQSINISLSLLSSRCCIFHSAASQVMSHLSRGNKPFLTLFKDK